MKRLLKVLARFRSSKLDLFFLLNTYTFINTIYYFFSLNEYINTNPKSPRVHTSFFFIFYYVYRFLYNYQSSSFMSSSGFLLRMSAFIFKTFGYSRSTKSNCFEVPFRKKFDVVSEAIFAIETWVFF
jgi:hypothetical protein